MQWEFVIALVVAIPIILFPAVFVWYLNIGGVYHAIQEARRKRKAAHEEKGKAVAESQHITVASIEKHAAKGLAKTKR